MKILIDITEDTYNSVCNESMLPPNVRNVIDGIKNGQLLPKDATNGDFVKFVFPSAVNSNSDLVDVFNNAKRWWNAPYRG